MSSDLFFVSILSLIIIVIIHFILKYYLLDDEDVKIFSIKQQPVEKLTEEFLTADDLKNDLRTPEQNIDVNEQQPDVNLIELKSELQCFVDNEFKLDDYFKSSVDPEEFIKSKFPPTPPGNTTKTPYNQAVMNINNGTQRAYRNEDSMVYNKDLNQNMEPSPFESNTFYSKFQNLSANIECTM